LSGDQARGFVAAVHAQASAGAIDVSIDGVFRDAEPAGDFFRAEMPVHKLEAFPLARAECVDVVNGRHTVDHPTKSLYLEMKLTLR
jgi:hypothetical protein